MIHAGELELTGRLPSASGALAAHVGAVYGAHDLAEPLPGGGILVTMANGSISFRPGEDGLTIQILGLSGADLFVLREAVASLVEAFDPALELVWDRALTATAHPPNFRIGRIVAKSVPAPRFLRLRVEADDLGPFSVNGLHLRLLLPPDDRPPVWPAVSDQGRTIWPEGPDRLHNPVYTIRAIDPAAGWLDIDVFMHGRGRTCHWAADANAGVTVGLVGPGGGDLPRARHLVLAGDETAFPAIARILESAPGETIGEAVLLVDGPEHRQPLSAPIGMTPRWLYRRDGASIEGALADADLPGPLVDGGRHLWIATERSEAARLRARYREGGDWNRGEATIAAYWTATDV